ncbi:SoxR reducing system RseC family protein [Miniphocaeibacter massiliensis]|uniref:SoxR reducing system RseC family protein n=1 Tax=Miniphocaeibacter massiliensis TaxID=2041841 RepID=UPI000C06E55F|nr:SoxR reducing system RseC family protein [Miniphocaeibacter massiliensis]
MEQKGKVIGIEDSFAKIFVMRSSGCGGKCDSCSGCSAENQPIIVKVNNDVDAKIGDEVILATQNGLIFKYSLYMYIIPLFFFVFGIVSGIILLSENNVTNYEILSFFIGLVFLLASLLLLKFLDKKFFNKNNDVIKIIKII